MLKNYLKIAIRNLIRHKGFALINILGLSVGIAAFMMIMLYVQYEFSYDKHFPGAENIYRVTLDMSWENTDLQETAIAPGPTAYYLQKDYPDVLAGTRLTLLDKLTIAYFPDDPGIMPSIFNEKNILATDSSFFRVFDIELIRGDKNNVLNQPKTIIISETAAEKYFGKQDPVGKILNIDNSEKAVVRGVMKDIPSNTHFKTDFIITGNNDTAFHINNWRTLGLYSYILLADNADPFSFEERFLEFEEKYYAPWKEHSRFRLQKMLDIHLRNDRIFDFARTNDAAMLYLLAVVAILILMIACINYMNLATARSVYRSKEVGIRKVIGATRGNIIIQFIGEALILSVIAIFIGVVITEFFLPEFRRLTQTNITLDYRINLVYFILLAFVIGIFSGSYPAFFTSSFQPISILKGSFHKGGGNILIRKILVVFQFVVMAVLLIASGSIYLQMSFIKNKNLGFDKDYLIYTMIENQPDNKKMQVLHNMLRTSPYINQVTTSNMLPGTTPWGDHFYVEGQDDFFPLRTFNVDPDFIPTLGMEVVAGRNFSVDYGTDSSACIINETAAKDFGWTPEEAIGKEMKWNFSSSWEAIIIGRVIGVAKDFHFKALREKIGPLVMTMHLPVNIILAAKINPEYMDEAISFMENSYNEINPDTPFDYGFLDKDLEELYMIEKRIGKIIIYFVILSVFIACLSLIGLSAFMAERKFNEIGIRKAFGASVGQILYIFNKEFMILVLIANVIAWPLSWFAIDSLLDNFAYRIDIPVWIFIASLIISCGIAFLTISILAYRAAGKNPVDALRYE